MLGVATIQLCLNGFLGTVVALDQSNLLETIMTFPFNIIVAMALVFVIAAVASFSRGPKNPVKEEIADVEIQPPEEFDEEMPRRFEDYRDGVIRLYDWFYRFAHSRIGAINDNMTPRDFQQAIMRSIPSDGAPALERLVTNYEIAVYSDSNSTKEMLESTLRSVELLRRLIQSRNQDEKASAQVPAI
ncbi:MAG: hypothetical protein ACFFDN_00720 [Candidatus Hodarchaeota archaeon]